MMPRHHRFLGRFRSSSAPPPRSLVEEAPPPRESPRIAEPRQHFWTRPFRAMMPQPASSDGDSQLREVTPAQSHPETSSSFTRLKAHLPGTGSIAERTSSLTDTVRSVAPGLLPPRPEDDDIITHTFCPDLSPRKRLYGFGICAVVGVGCYFLAFVALSSVAATGTKPFAFLLTIGNVVTLLGTFFIAGPKAQFRMMMKRHRIQASAVFVLAMALTFVAAFSHHFMFQTITIVVLSVVQMAALLWYCLSYIPFARRLMSRCIGFIRTMVS